MAGPNFTENAQIIFDARYSRKDDEGNPTETPEEVIWRVASNVASVEALYGQHGVANWEEVTPQDWWSTAHRRFDSMLLHGDDRFIGQSFERVMAEKSFYAEDMAIRFAEMIGRLDFLPNSPTWTGAGTPLGQLAACFVLPIADDLGRQRDSIFETLRVAALIQQTGGGNGFSLGRLRPAGETIKTSMGKSSGPMGFLSMYDAAFGKIAQGGSRRGANMGVMPIWHPDVRAFIGSKVVEGEIANFNLSVAITDEFMRAVFEDGDFDLRHGSKVYETVRARDLFDEVVNNAWVMGDPGNLFIDRANRQNPVPLRYELEATNPCGEQWLGPYENCCLGSVSVSHFVRGHYLDGGAQFDWAEFANVVTLATRFLDDVVDANQYVPDVPELAEAAEGGRRIGLGLMGLADAMLAMGLPYGSTEGIEFAAQVTEFARYHCMCESIELARERGPFGWIKDSIYDPELLAAHGIGALVELPAQAGHPRSGEQVEFRLWDIPRPLDEYAIDFGRPAVHWPAVVDGIMEHGIRNSCQFTFAPTGTISNVAMLEGSGCEPLFALAYVRTMMQESENVELTYASPAFEKALELCGIEGEERDAIFAEVSANGGSCQGISSVPQKVRRVFVTAGDVTPSQHVRTQAALQAFVDNSISKTINMPNSATREDVAEAYRLAYELGCKGITIYRQGSRELEVLSTKQKEIEEAVEEIAHVVDPSTIEELWSKLMNDDAAWPTIDPKPIPEYALDQGLNARVFPLDTFYGKVQVTITELVEHPGRPFDVRLQVGRAGNDTNAHVEALGRMISLSLRAGVGVHHVIHQLEGIGGRSSVGFGPRRVSSVADGVAKLLKRLYTDAYSLPAQVAASMPTVTEQVTVSSFTSALGDTPGFAASSFAASSTFTATELCPNCNNASVIMESGCRHCDPRLGGCGEFSGCD